MDPIKATTVRVGIAAALAALAAIGSLPGAASADVVGDAVKGLGLDKPFADTPLGGPEGIAGPGGAGAGQTSGSSSPHAQGTVANLDLSDQDGPSGEELVLGRSSAQRNQDGSYQ